MIVSCCRATATVLALVIVLIASRASAEEIIGTWLTANSDAHIRVARCGRSLCGSVAWLRTPIDSKTGQPLVDDKNPNPAMRNRKILGIRIFVMDQDNAGAWAGGIYNSDDGQIYKGRLAPRGADELEVQGCAGALCGSEVWTRAK
jgi:uncharacterized protein (DUF2147 family)